MNCSTASVKKRPSRRRRWWAVWGLACTLLAPAATAQVVPAPAGRHLQVGLAALPGGGLQLGYLSLRSFYTQEFIFNADVSPGFGDGEGNVQLSGGLGGAIRVFGFERTLGNAGYRGYDIDVGLRFGPGLLFAFKETRFTKNQRFSLFLDLFARFSSAFGPGRLFFLEVGLHRPVLRGGLWFAF